ncbi:class I SAM-dependent methyltransferase [Synechococcus sp. AH-224-G16]|nr:class I SAM-dependent methyltransferase [Synechococcus sp. AH-224-G16]
MSGLIHHLSDELVEQFIDKAYAVLKDGGRLLAIENFIHSKQSKLKKKVILMDRGEHVRELSHHHSLIEKSKMHGLVTIEENLFLIPCTHAILSLKKKSTP